MNETLQFLIALGIPSFIMGIGLKMIQRKMDQADKRRANEEKVRLAREKEREQHELLILRCIGASIELGEVTAQALRAANIDGVKINGQLDEAIETAAAAKKCQREFLQERGVRHLV